MIKIQLSPAEVKIIQMALQTLIEDVTEMSQDQTLPLTPEARSIQRDLIATGKTAWDKIATISGHRVEMEPYQPGDENEFFTKQS